MPDVHHDSKEDGDRLKGWKEIAQCLHSSERTVQRWEHVLHLPVHRIGTPGNPTVLASRWELADWLESIEGRTALSEQADSESLLDPQADSRFDDAGVAVQESLTPGMLDGAPDPRATLETRWTTASPRWRRFGWVLLGLGAVALFVGFVPLDTWFGWISPSSEHTGAPRTPPAAADASVPESATPARTTSVAVRFTVADGASSIVGIQVGGTSTITVGNHTTYVFSAELLGDVARVHVAQLDGGTAQNAPRLNELAVVTLHQGARLPVTQVPGITAMEWVEPAALTKRWGKKPG